MSRRLALLFSLLLIFAAYPAAAVAFNQGTSGSSNAGGGGTGGSANNFAVNDLGWNGNDQVRFTYDIVSKLIGGCISKGLTIAAQCQFQGALYRSTKTGSSFGPSTLSHPKADVERSGSKFFGGDREAYSWAQDALTKSIGIYNIYGLPKGGATNYLLKPLGSLGDSITQGGKTMAQLHPPGPGRSVTIGGVIAPKGTAILGIMRVWRQNCSLGRLKKQNCLAKPLIVRAPAKPLADHALGRDAYMKNGGLRSDQTLTASGAVTAGPVWGSCDANPGTRSYCYTAGESYAKNRLGRIGSFNPQKKAYAYYEQACYNGGIAGGGGVHQWSPSEFLQQFDYLSSQGLNQGPQVWKNWSATGRSQRFQKIRDNLERWLNNQRRGSKWPDLDGSGAINRTDQQAACQFFSEWIALRWDMASLNGAKNDFTFRIIGNAIPGRVYVTQVAAYDSRESLILERITTFVAGANSVSRNSCFAVDQQSQEPQLEHPRRSVRWPTGAPEPRDCLRRVTETPAYGGPSPELSLNHEILSSQSAGQSNPLRNSRSTAGVSGAEQVKDNVLVGSLMVPRAVQVAVSNPDNPTQDKFQANHPGLSMTSADFGSLGNVAVEKDGAIHTFLPQQQWWHTLLPLQPYQNGDSAKDLVGVAPGGANLSEVALTGYGAGLQLAVQQPTRAPGYASADVAGPGIDPTPGQKQSLLDKDVAVNEARVFSFLSEDRYPGSWNTSGASVLCNSVNLSAKPSKPLCPAPENKIVSRNLRLTLDRCDANGPLVQLPGSPLTLPCSTSILGQKIADGMSIRDAYQVPSLPPASQVELPVLFVQAKDGKAQISYQLTPSVPVYGIDIYTLDDYLNRMQGASVSPVQIVDGSLPAGSYVAVARVINQAGGTPLPAFSWGATGTLMDVKDRAWVSRFSVQNKFNSVAVFQPRALG